MLSIPELLRTALLPDPTREGIGSGEDARCICGLYGKRDILQGVRRIWVSRAVSLATLRSGRRVPNDAHSGCMMYEACASCGGTSFTDFPSRSVPAAE